MASKFFNFIIYADDTTLYTPLEDLNRFTVDKINRELDNVVEWLNINKLSINVKKCKFMIFRMPQKKIVLPTLTIDKQIIECVEKFNFLGIIIHQNLKWEPHIKEISYKITKTIGVMNN